MSALYRTPRCLRRPRPRRAHALHGPGPDADGARHGVHPPPLGEFAADRRLDLLAHAGAPDRRGIMSASFVRALRAIAVLTSPDDLGSTSSR